MLSGPHQPQLPLEPEESKDSGEPRSVEPKAFKTGPFQEVTWFFKGLKAAFSGMAHSLSNAFSARFRRTGDMLQDCYHTVEDTRLVRFGKKHYILAGITLVGVVALGIGIGIWKGADLRDALMATLHQERLKLATVTDQLAKTQEELNNLRLQAQAALQEAKLAASQLAEKERELKRFDGVRGGITINTVPEGAVVRVGGDAVMITPATFEGLLSQKYPVEIELPGYDPITMEVEVAPQAFTDLGTLTLHRQFGDLAVTSSPEGAHVELIGSDEEKKVGKTPINFSQIPTGTYRLKISQPDYPVLEREVVVTKEKPEIVDWAFGVGNLLIKTEPEGADVMLDGKVVGKSPLNLALKSGSYVVSIKFAPWEAQDKPIIVSKGVTNEVSFELTMAALEVTTSQPGVSIWCGDTFLGQTPVSAEIPVGRHTLWAVAPGAKAQSQTVELAQGEKKSVEFRPLEALPPPNVEGAPSEQYLQLYLQAQQGEKLIQEGKAFDAYVSLLEVQEGFLEFRKAFPDFETAVVLNRQRALRERLLALEQGQALSQNTLRAAPKIPEASLPLIETDPPQVP
jgi:hypothetical protein